MPVYNGKVMTGLASFDRGKAANWLSPSTVFGFDSDLLEVREYPLTLRRLDDLGLKPDFIKIDVQGLEESVVRVDWRQSRRTILRFLLESPKPSLIELLSRYGYQMWGPRSVNQFFLRSVASATEV